MGNNGYKYFYNNICISEYCDKNHLDINVIRARIFRYKNKYPEKTIDEIVDMAINYKRESQEKYYYENMTLSKYCEKHNLNFLTIKARIVKLTKKNPDKQIDEIIDMAINYIDTSKNYYNGILLTEYCKKNNLNINAIKSRIFRLKKEYQQKNIDEIIDSAINFEKKKNYKYYYQGKPLIEYCEENKIDYKTLCSRILYLKNKNPDKDINEITELAINFKKKKNYKYYYQGKPLIKYCEENKLDYEKIYVRLKYLISKNFDKNIEDIIELAINPSKKTNKYNYQGIPLIEYCKKNNLNIEIIKSRMSRLKKEYPEKDIDDIIELAINFEKKIYYKYYYQGMPLIEYCKKNNLNIEIIKSRMSRLKKEYPEKDIDDIIELAINYDKKKNIKYYYDKKPLTEYCKQKEINYSSVLVRINKYKKKNPELKIDKIIELAVNSDNEKIKYNYKGMSLYKYCVENNINYYTIFSRIWRKVHNNQEVDVNEIMDSYYEDLNKKKKKYILQKVAYDDVQELISCCNFIDISYESVKYLQEIGFTVKDSVNIVYFFGELGSSNQKVISQDFIYKIFDYIDNIKLIKNDKKKLDDNLLILYKLYKCNLYDSRELIIKDFKQNIYKLIYKALYIFQINKNNEKIDDLYNELNYRLLELIDSCFTLNKYELLKYVMKSLKYYCFSYCYNNFVNKNISLDMELVKNKNMYNIIDGSLDGLSLEQEIEIDIDGHFSENLEKIINELDKNSLYFIKLKYIYNYDNSYIATVMKLTIDEVNKMEIELINYLKNKPEVISLVYKK